MYDQIFPQSVDVPEFNPEKQVFYAVAPSYLINNRSDKRAFRKDATRATEFLQWVIDDFITDVFDSDSRILYSTIYAHYLDLWKATIKHMKKIKPRLNNIKIDEGFFARNYSPAT